MEREPIGSASNKAARIFEVRILLPNATPLDDRAELDGLFKARVARIGGIVISSNLMSAAEVAERTGPGENGDVPYDAPFLPGPHLFNQGVQAALNTPIERILAPEGVGWSLKGQLRRLQNMGYVSARDLILGGMDYLRSEHRIHARTRDRLREGLRRECPAVPIRNAWRPEDVALFCKLLDEIPLYTLRNTFLPSRNAPLDQAVIQGRWQSIQGFLERARNESALTQAEKDYNVKGLALAFAVAFEAKRQSLKQSEG